MRVRSPILDPSLAPSLTAKLALIYARVFDEVVRNGRNYRNGFVTFAQQHRRDVKADRKLHVFQIANAESEKGRKKEADKERKIKINK